MIFPEHRAIFFHVGRTAGTSVEKLLRDAPRDPQQADFESLFGRHPTERYYLQHATCEATLELVGRERFDAFFKFTVVRSPWTRLVSVYFYEFHNLRKEHGSFKGYIEALPSIIADPERRKGSHALSQRCYTHIGADQVVDAIVRFEELPGSMDVVRARLGITAELEKTNATRYPSVTRKPTAEHYDDEMIAVMRRVYADDFALYGYPDTPPEALSD